MSRSSIVLGTLLLVGAAAACGGEKAAPAAAGSASAATPAAASSDPRAQIFLAKGCQQCHSIGAVGIKSPTDVGPDLSRAAEDVETRFGVELRQFLNNPTGTMQVVLSSQIILSPAERDSIVRLLERLAEDAERPGAPERDHGGGD